MTASADIAALWRRRTKVRVAYGVLAAAYAACLVVLLVMAVSTSRDRDEAVVFGAFAAVQVLAVVVAVVLVVLNVRALRVGGFARGSLRRAARRTAVGAGVLLLAVIGVTVAGWAVGRADVVGLPAFFSTTLAFGAFSAFSAGMALLVAGATSAALRSDGRDLPA